MLIFKIICCIVIGFIGFYAFLQANSLKELKEKATEVEKDALGKIELIALGLPLLIICFIVAP